jgi:hypothetical protein
MSIESLRIDTQKNLITHELPPLCMVTENIFGHHKIGDKN